VIEDTLREGLARGLRTEIGSETERGVHRQVGLHHVQRSTNLLLLREDVTTTTIESRVDTTHCPFGTLDFNQVDRLKETSLSGQHGGVEALSGSGDDLTTTSVDGISVEDDIVDVESDTSQVFVAKDTFLGGPGKGSNARVLDFVQVLHTLGDINKHVGTRVLIRTEAPDLTGISGVPLEFLSEDASTHLNLLTAFNLTLINGLSQVLLERLSSHVETVVFVGGL
jgi:hypothetical protein